MIDPKILREQTQMVADRLATRGMQFDQATYSQLEGQRRKLQTRLEELQNQRNVSSKAIGVAKSKKEDVSDLMAKMSAQAEELAQTEQQFAEVQNELQNFCAQIPNLPHESVPVGKSEKDNREERRWGTPKTFAFTPKDHVDLGGENMDFAGGAKISGARFVVLKGKLARLQRALIQFMLDVHTTEHGYEEVYVPSIVNSTSAFGTGQLPKFAEDLFALKGEQNYYLIPTAEVPVTNLMRDEIIDAKLLPKKYVCYSPCFRSEAGSYGKDTRGMIRNHQFEKVELVQFTYPEQSYETLEQLTHHAETILQRLQLPYRVVSLCSGDLGFSAAKTYDLEVWLPSQNTYREISSCSNFEDFQARRMQARYRVANGKPAVLHTLNGSGLAVGRTLIAIMENNQDEQGRIHIPEALQPYIGCKVI